jgi:hypothetical protein
MEQLLVRDIVARDLENLQTSYEQLVAKQKELDEAVQRQLGGIYYAQMLLQKMDEAAVEVGDVEPLVE